MKKTLALILALLMLLALAGCAVNGTTAADDATAGMAPAEAAEAALDTTQDKMSISDIVRVPFGYLLDWLDRFANNYGVALILFSLIVKLVLLPMSIKGKKSMLKMSRLAPMAKALEEKYGDDKQKYQVALSQLYKDEGVSMGGGCLWSFIPLLILLPLYYVIREPITYMMHNSRSIAAAVVAYIQASGVELGGNAYYAQLSAAGHLGEFLDELKALPILEGAKLREISFSFIGIDLASIPTFQFWKWENPTWSQIGLFLIPVVSAGLQAVSMVQPEDEQQGRDQCRRRTGRGRCQDREPDQHDHDADDAAHVSLDRLLHARRDLHLLDRAGCVRRNSGLFPDRPLPQGL